ncbi:MAG: 2-C-methyl-D-erythritol 2,4-cyclodiphosphate synthase, partial [Candidatus Cloacimonadota bacterium]|nr:2-C-methyl-D-erythritol 2,4-cyclodiphosphate synthase [Candidatus Cloacimonadota bacterium]
IDSRILLRKTYEIIIEKGYVINNLDSTICAQAPKLNPFISEMRKIISEDLNTNIENISVKATTEEGLGFSGKKEGISATCVVLIV